MQDQRIKNALQSEPYQSLYEIAYGNCQQSRQSTEAPQKQITGKGPGKDLSAAALMLVSDVLNFPQSNYRQRVKRLGKSARQLDTVRAELTSAGLAKDIWVGKTMFIAPLPALYELMQIECPYKRNISIEHSFLTLLAQRIIAQWPTVQTTKPEYPIAETGSTVDLLVITKNGDRIAYEITLSASNICSNIAKLTEGGFCRIVLLCRDYDIKQTALASINNAGFDSEFITKIRCTVLSSLFKGRRKHKSRKEQP